jgi:hypothetical protein
VSGHALSERMHDVEIGHYSGSAASKFLATLARPILKVEAHRDLKTLTLLWNNVPLRTQGLAQTHSWAVHS